MFEADPRGLPEYTTGIGIRSFSLRRLIVALITLVAFTLVVFFWFLIAPIEVAIYVI